MIFSRPLFLGGPSCVLAPLLAARISAALLRSRLHRCCIPCHHSFALYMC
ncbi:hypothetical protein GQ55_8G085600 [Panicum hallii var. hallii]|uniref:Uncharacterized protein n=1 Tax=Panicum hallii var. hallii TaxID=1504633 RepID=A0A2T7CM19_9POAL|nr:hypothetical protein GQ55_8G085600 [Panicum hallii var. hallii]